MSTETNKPLTCCNCDFEFSALKSATPGVSDAPLDSDMLLCGQCGKLLIKNHLVTREMTLDEYNQLHPDDKNALYWAIRDIQGKARMMKKLDEVKLHLPPWLQTPPDKPLIDLN